jgi:hypothetical protein
MGITGYANGKIPMPLEQRLMAKVRRGGPGECRLQWDATVNNHGYPTISRGYRLGPMYAHRAMYEAVYERPIPKGLEIDHLCGRGAQGCVTPEHFELVTRGENQRRSNYRRWHGVR